MFSHTRWEVFSFISKLNNRTEPAIFISLVLHISSRFSHLEHIKTKFLVNVASLFHICIFDKLYVTRKKKRKTIITQMNKYFVPMRQSLYYFGSAGKFRLAHELRQLYVTRDTDSNVHCYPP